jgi:hypothetical protein
MLKEILFALLLIPCLFIPSIGQVSGVVTDDEGNVLPFATVAIEGTSRGTVANNEGLYEISFSDGQVTLIFQYIGYKTEYVDATYAGQPLNIDVSLSKQAINIDEIVIAADAEDPAYGIMRKVIANRDKHLKAIQNFQGDVYIKGQIKVLEAPETFMGQEVGNMEGILDTTGQGIVYLSESQSTIYFNYPSEIKEVMKSSIVAGDDSGFSFNQFSMVNFNFYYENIRFDRSLNTPLNDNALRNYRFKLLGTFMDKEGRLINQIEVEPIHDNYPLFNGLLYIVDGEWVIHSLDLSFSGKAIKNRFFDFIRIRQVMRHDDNKQLWYLNNQIIDFESGFFSFRFGGRFSYVFNEVILNEGPYEIGNEVFAMEEDALDRTTSFWDSIRPIPLTMEEEKDYIKKDSLEILRESKEYLDSIDNRNNKLTLGSLLFGYSHNNSYKDQYFRARSPLTSVSFNTVEGFSTGISGTYRKYSDGDDNRLFIAPSIRYGFSDKLWKYEVRSNYRFSRKRFSFLTLNAGRVLDQFDNRDPVSTGLNTWGSLVRKENLLKLYRKDYLTLQYQQELFNGFYAWLGFHYENRKRVSNNSDFSIFNKDRVYEVNLPFIGIDEGLITDNRATRLSLTLRWRPGQKYFSYPNFKLRIPSEWPDFYVFYDKGLEMLGAESDFDKLRFRIAKTRVDIGEKGYFGFQLEGGTFLNDEEVFFVDYFHFASQAFRLAFYERYLSQFKLLNLYTPSTTKDYSTFFMEYHFDGYLMDRLPLIRNTSLKLVLGYGALFTDEKPYHEFSLGVENIGIGPLSFLRFDYVWSVQGEGILDHGIKIGLSQVINDFAN